MHATVGDVVLSGIAMEDVTPDSNLHKTACEDTVNRLTVIVIVIKLV